MQCLYPRRFCVNGVIVFLIYKTSNNYALNQNHAQIDKLFTGITCRLDVVELLEKRVKSRFSHRQIFLFPGNEDSQISSLDNKIAQVTNYLTLSEPSKQDNLSIAVKKQWNKMVHCLTENKKFKSLIQRLIDIDMDEQTLKNVLVCYYLFLIKLCLINDINFRCT